MKNTYTVFTGKLSEIDLTKKSVINTINQYSYCIAEEDDDFKKALLASDILLPDGIAIVLLHRLLYKKKIKKIAGADIHHYLLNKLNQNGGSCFYLGASDATLDLIRQKLIKEFPNVKVATFSPPFKKIFTEAENREMIKRINDFHPDVLFVGMTAPKQEKWVNENKESINTKAIASIGAVFDFYAGTKARPGKIWISLGLEWFVRFLKEPKRMWRRYFYYGPVFLFLAVKEKARLVWAK